MDRKKFIEQVGIVAGSTILFTCIGCSKSGNASPSTAAPSNVDFTLDLSASANAALSTNGGYVYSNRIIVARTLAGNYIAVSQTCTHETYTVVYQGNNSRFYCANHGATFSETGAVTNGPANSALKQYTTALSGTSLRITG